MTREEIVHGIADLKEQQRLIWQGGLPCFLAMRACQLGLCGEMDRLEEEAMSATDPEAASKARLRLQAKRSERERGWQMIARQIEQIEIAIAVLRKGMTYA